MAHSRPLAIDLFTGCHGWSEGLVAAGYEVIGFDIEDMSAQFGQPKPEHFHLVVQDVLTLHGSQFRKASLIVASPPCQEYSYMAMPWTKAKDKAAHIRSDASGQARRDLTRLFDSCFRIQREASEAAGHHIPLVVENVRGAQEWVGRAAWNFGSYYLWGDVPALMPMATARKNSHVGGGSWFAIGAPGQISVNGNPDGRKSHGMNWSDQTKRGQDFTRIAGEQAGVKCGGTWFHGYRSGQGPRNHGSKSVKRKAASALIAKIPFPLSFHIAQVWHPQREAA